MISKIIKPLVITFLKTISFLLFLLFLLLAWTDYYEIYSKNIFVDFKPYGFNPPDEIAKDGLQNIVEGRAIPFPLTLRMMSKIALLHFNQSIKKRWKSEGTIPNPFLLKGDNLTKVDNLNKNNKRTGNYLKEGLLIGMGDAIYKEVKENKGEGKTESLTLITKTCFQCHAGIAPGRKGVKGREPKIVAGLGHAHNDFVPSVSALSSYGQLSRDWSNETLKDELKKVKIDFDGEKIQVYKDFKTYAGEIFFPSLVYSDTRGDNQGPYAVWYFVAKLDDPAKTGIAMRKECLDLGEKTLLTKIGNFLAKLTSSDGKGAVKSQDCERTEEEYLLKEGIEYFPTVDPLPWFNARFKTRHYYFWDAPGLGHYDFNMNFWVPHEAIDSVDEVKKKPKEHLKKILEKIYTIATVLHYARTLPIPRYPYDFDESDEIKKGRESLVVKGRELFHNKKMQYRFKVGSDDKEVTCSYCHGIYKKMSEAIGNWEVTYCDENSPCEGSDSSGGKGLQYVETDPLYNTILRKYAPLADKAGKTRKYYKKQLCEHKKDSEIEGLIKKIQDLEKELGVKKGLLLEGKKTGDIGPHSYAIKKKGYPAPVLTGIWASAPYLHNGSVPTLMDLLSPESQRPKIWGRMISDPNAYDWEKVGLKYETISEFSYDHFPQSPIKLVEDFIWDTEFRRYYDTRNIDHGRSNKGHDFGTDWSLEEKKAVITFLTDISGKEVHPKIKQTLERYEDGEHTGDYNKERFCNKEKGSALDNYTSTVGG